MKPDEFEDRLSRQPLRPVPSDWRADILRAAQAAPARTQTGWLHDIGRELYILLWPNSKAWAGLAAVWVLIAAVHFSMRDTTRIAMTKPVTPSPALMAELKNQQRIFAELTDQADPQDTDRQKNFRLKPRSEHAEFPMI